MRTFRLIVIRSVVLFGHDLRANASRWSLWKTASTFPDHASGTGVDFDEQIGASAPRCATPLVKWDSPGARSVGGVREAFLRANGAGLRDRASRFRTAPPGYRVAYHPKRRSPPRRAAVRRFPFPVMNKPPPFLRACRAMVPSAGREACG